MSTATSPASTSTGVTDVLVAFLENVARDPGHPAAKDTIVDLDYADLRDEVAAVAAGLAGGLRVCPGDRVALHLPNSADFLVAALACMWVGAMFVPLSAVDPPARVAAIVDDCAPAVVLTNPTIVEPHPSAVSIADVKGESSAAPPAVTSMDRPAYAIYTSGTTGVPKGVVIGRRAFAIAVRRIIDNLLLDPDTRTLCVSPFHFDGSFATLFPTIAVGGRVVIPPRDALLFARYFFRTVVREQITYTGFSTTYLRLLLSSPQLTTLEATPLDVVALGGEACSLPDVVALQAAAPKLRVFNRYGPTETTIAVTHFHVTREVQQRDTPVPIGLPHSGVEFVLVGEDGAVVDEPDAVGELYIGGDQLMDGYWGAPKLSAQVLRQDIVAGRTVYRTGDLVRRDADANYVYVDRADRVIKRNAVRISLIELADTLRALPGVTAATCPTFDNDGELGIAAFVVAHGDPSAVEIRRAAGEKLPTTMLPDRIEIVDLLPLTSSGKVDERLLLADAGLTATQA